MESAICILDFRGFYMLEKNLQTWFYNLSTAIKISEETLFFIQTENGKKTLNDL